MRTASARTRATAQLAALKEAAQRSAARGEELARSNAERVRRLEAEVASRDAELAALRESAVRLCEEADGLRAEVRQRDEHAAEAAEARAADAAHAAAELRAKDDAIGHLVAEAARAEAERAASAETRERLERALEERGMAAAATAAALEAEVRALREENDELARARLERAQRLRAEVESRDARIVALAEASTKAARDADAQRAEARRRGDALAALEALRADEAEQFGEEARAREAALRSLAEDVVRLTAERAAAAEALAEAAAEAHERGERLAELEEAVASLKAERNALAQAALERTRQKQAEVQGRDMRIVALGETVLQLTRDADDLRAALQERDEAAAATAARHAEDLGRLGEELRARDMALKALRTDYDSRLAAQDAEVARLRAEAKEEALACASRICELVVDVEGRDAHIRALQDTLLAQGDNVSSRESVVRCTDEAKVQGLRMDSDQAANELQREPEAKRLSEDMARATAEDTVGRAEEKATERALDAKAEAALAAEECRVLKEQVAELRAAVKRLEAERGQGGAERERLWLEGILAKETALVAQQEAADSRQAAEELRAVLDELKATAAAEKLVLVQRTEAGRARERIQKDRFHDLVSKAQAGLEGLRVIVKERLIGFELALRLTDSTVTNLSIKVNEWGNVREILSANKVLISQLKSDLEGIQCEISNTVNDMRRDFDLDKTDAAMSLAAASRKKEHTKSVLMDSCTSLHLILNECACAASDMGEIEHDIYFCESEYRKKCSVHEESLSQFRREKMRAEVKLDRAESLLCLCKDQLVSFSDWAKQRLLETSRKAENCENAVGKVIPLLKLLTSSCDNISQQGLNLLASTEQKEEEISALREANTDLNEELQIIEDSIDKLTSFVDHTNGKVVLFTSKTIVRSRSIITALEELKYISEEYMKNTDIVLLEGLKHIETLRQKCHDSLTNSNIESQSILISLLLDMKVSQDEISTIIENNIQNEANEMQRRIELAAASRTKKHMESVLMDSCTSLHLILNECACAISDMGEIEHDIYFCESEYRKKCSVHEESLSQFRREKMRAEVKLDRAESLLCLCKDQLVSFSDWAKQRLLETSRKAENCENAVGKVIPLLKLLTSSCCNLSQAQMKYMDEISALREVNTIWNEELQNIEDTTNKIIFYASKAKVKAITYVSQNNVFRRRMMAELTELKRINRESMQDTDHILLEIFGCVIVLAEQGSTKLRNSTVDLQKVLDLVRSGSTAEIQENLAAGYFLPADLANVLSSYCNETECNRTLLGLKGQTILALILESMHRDKIASSYALLSLEDMPIMTASLTPELQGLAQSALEFRGLLPEECAELISQSERMDLMELLKWISCECLVPACELLSPSDLEVLLDVLSPEKKIQIVVQLSNSSRLALISYYSKAEKASIITRLAKGPAQVFIREMQEYEIHSVLGHVKAEERKNIELGLQISNAVFLNQFERFQSEKLLTLDFVEWMKPKAIAQILELQIDSEVKLLDLLPTELVASVIDELLPSFRVQVLCMLSADTCQRIIPAIIQRSLATIIDCATVEQLDVLLVHFPKKSHHAIRTASLLTKMTPNERLLKLKSQSLKSLEEVIMWLVPEYASTLISEMQQEDRQGLLGNISPSVRFHLFANMDAVQRASCICSLSPAHRTTVLRTFTPEQILATLEVMAVKDQNVMLSSMPTEERKCFLRGKEYNKMGSDECCLALLATEIQNCVRLLPWIQPDIAAAYFRSIPFLQGLSYLNCSGTKWCKELLQPDFISTLLIHMQPEESTRVLVQLLPSKKTEVAHKMYQSELGLLVSRLPPAEKTSFMQIIPRQLEILIKKFENNELSDIQQHVIVRRSAQMPVKSDLPSNNLSHQR